jgi:hypothetical protein
VSRSCASRRAPALAACALAVGTWLVPASSHHLAIEPTLQLVGGWVTGLLSNPPWRSTARAEAALDASAPTQ